MTDNLYRDVVEAIVAVCEGLDLPPHNTVKYRRPMAVIPEDCPLLTVWVADEAITPQTTEWLNSDISIGVSWQESAVDSAMTLMEDPERSLSLLAAVQLIKRGLWRTNVQGWSVEGAYELTPVSVAYSEPRTYQSLDTGLVEGYSLTVRVSVEEGAG